MPGGPGGGVWSARNIFSTALVRSWFERGTRYARTYWWLWQQQTITGRRQFILAIFFGLISRLGQLVVLVVSMKCALWLLRPESLPSIITGILPGGADSQLVVPLLVSMPAAVMFGALLTHHLHNKLADRHKSELAYQIAFRSITRQFEASRPAGAPKRRELLATAAGIVRQLEQLVARLVRVEANVLSIIIQSTSLVMAVALSLFLDPIITAVMVPLGLIAGMAFVSRRHGQFQKLTQEREVLQGVQVEARKQVVEDLASQLVLPSDPKSLETTARGYDSVARNRRLKEVGFRNMSTILVSAGQSVLILGLLIAIYIRGVPENAHEITMTIILLLVLRGTLGLIRGIAVSAVGLSRDYVMLVELAEGRTVSEAEGPDPEILDREDQIL